MRSVIARTCFYALGLSLSIALAASHAGAQAAIVGGPVAPELDGASVSTGLGLLGAAILIVRARRRPK